MLDILHYLFDQDTTFTSPEHAESRSGTRNAVYEHLYNMKYPYAWGTRSNTTIGDDFDDDFALPPIDREVKPYFPPTQFDPDAANPFQGVLREAPLG